jgi:aryl-phospho-beta-D-glucosidase BglC (GH1 family)
MKLTRTLLLVLPFCLSYQSGFSQPGAAFIRKQASQLVVGAANQPIYLRGINLIFDRIVLPDGRWTIGTCEILNRYPSTTPVTNWYSERHLQSLADIGFNVIRMDLHYRIFEDDSNPGVYKQSGWEFLDTYIQWAANQNLYLILDMHVPPGGLQPTGGGGACLWEDSANQERLVNLWRAIARRYAGEPRIAAYDLLNEPNPTGATLQAGAANWQSLAQQIIDTIRTVDPNHLVIVERVNWLVNADGSSPLRNWELGVLKAFQVSVTDDNSIYDFHFYNPIEYALQNEGRFPDDGNYPDANTSQRAKDGALMPRDKRYLDYELQMEIRGTAPMFVGEWGPNPSTFNDTKGGYTYIRDLLDLMEEQQLHWAYYAIWNLYTINCCTEGVVCCSGENETTPAYPELIDLFTGYFDSLATSVRGLASSIPATFALQQNYPNPFNPSTVISFQLPVFSEIELAVYDIRGRRIAILRQGKFAAGVHKVRWQPGASVPSGMYFLRLRVDGGEVKMRKVLFMK